jgi:hypothetical protein
VRKFFDFAPRSSPLRSVRRDPKETASQVGCLNQTAISFCSLRHRCVVTLRVHFFLTIWYVYSRVYGKKCSTHLNISQGGANIPTHLRFNSHWGCIKQDQPGVISFHHIGLRGLIHPWIDFQVPRNLFSHVLDRGKPFSKKKHQTFILLIEQSCYVIQSFFLLSKTVLFFLNTNVTTRLRLTTYDYEIWRGSSKTGLRFSLQQSGNFWALADEFKIPRIRRRFTWFSLSRACLRVIITSVF